MRWIADIVCKDHVVTDLFNDSQLTQEVRTNPRGINDGITRRYKEGMNSMRDLSVREK
jgi:hypothetical protein